MREVASGDAASRASSTTARTAPHVSSTRLGQTRASFTLFNPCNQPPNVVVMRSGGCTLALFARFGSKAGSGRAGGRAPRQGVLVVCAEPVAEIVVGDLASEGRAGLDGEAVVHSGPDAGVVDLSP